MEAKIQEILNEIFELEPSMKQNIDNIQEVVKKMLEVKPDTNFDKNFEIRLKNQLLEEINLSKKKKEKTKKINFLLIISWTLTFAWISGMIITTMLLTKPTETIKPEISYVDNWTRNESLEKAQNKIIPSSEDKNLNVTKPKELKKVDTEPKSTKKSSDSNSSSNTRKTSDLALKWENTLEKTQESEQINEEMLSLMSTSPMMKWAAPASGIENDSPNDTAAMDTSVSSDMQVYKYTYKWDKIAINEELLKTYSGSKIITNIDEIIKIAENWWNYKNPWLPEKELELWTPKLEKITIWEQTVPAYIFPVLNKKEWENIPDNIYVNIILE